MKESAAKCSGVATESVQFFRLRVLDLFCGAGGAALGLSSCWI